MTSRTQATAASTREDRANPSRRARHGDSLGVSPDGLTHLRAATGPRNAQLLALQGMVQGQPAVQRVMQLQQAADAAGIDETPAIAAPLIRDNRLRTTPPADAAQRRGSGNLRGTTHLQRQMPTHGAVQYPALIGAPNTPLAVPLATQMGAVVTQMKRADYDTWQGSLGARITPHGVMHQGDRSTVARWQQPSAVMQQFSFPLSQKMKAGLVMAEASLTILAGVAGLVAGVGFGAIPLVCPSILAVLTGAVKFGRGYLMYQKDAPEGKKLAAIDTMRTIEAMIAGIGALMADPTSFYKIPAMVFSIAKLVRSLATALADLIDEKTGKKPSIFVKGLRALSAVAHAVEVAAIGFSSGAGIVEGIGKVAADGSEVASGAARAVAGITGMGIGTSKAARTADQFRALKRKPAAAPQAGAAVAGNVQDEDGDAAPGPAPVILDHDDAAVQPDAAPEQDRVPTREENERKYAKQIAYGKRVAGIYDWSDEVVYEMAIAGSFDENVRAIEENDGPDPSYLT